MNRNKVKVGFNEMPVNVLCSYVMDDQHVYLKNTLPMVVNCLTTITHDETKDIGSKILVDSISKLINKITEYLDMEETVLFPYLLSVMKINASPSLKRLSFSVKRIKSEHQSISRLFRKVRLLSNNYTPDEKASSLIKLCYAQLFNFEQDILRHIFIEEDVLFPKLKMK